MGITPDDVAYDLHNQEVENETMAIGIAVQEGTAMCGGCAQALEWLASTRTFHCTTSGCDFKH